MTSLAGRHFGPKTFCAGEKNCAEKFPWRPARTQKNVSYVSMTGKFNVKFFEKDRTFQVLDRDFVK
jgi:hypothetical protein